MTCASSWNGCSNQGCQSLVDTCDGHEMHAHAVTCQGVACFELPAGWAICMQCPPLCSRLQKLRLCPNNASPHKASQLLLPMTCRLSVLSVQLMHGAGGSTKVWQGATVESDRHL